MSRRILFATLFLLQAVIAHAGSGTIQETDTEIIVEYTGDENDSRVEMPRQEDRHNVESKEEDQKAKATEVVKGKAAFRPARKARNREEDE